MNKDGIGFVTIAQNTTQVDYLKLAYVQALQFKVTNPTLRYAIIVDQQTNKDLPNLKYNPFDHVIVLNEDYNHEGSQWKLANECQIFKLSPFKETFKVEADLLLPKTITHILPILRSKDVVISTGCKDFQGNISNVRTYRQFFDQNNLPDLYSGLMYFRYSQFASKFFEIARNSMHDWTNVKNFALKNCREEYPSTDVLFSVTALIMGIENCSIPTLDCFNFIHLKPAINQWLNSYEWHDLVMYEFNDAILRVNNLNLLDPTHYQSKNFINEEIIQHFENLYEQRI